MIDTHEVQRLTTASQTRRLTDAERLRLAGLTWTPDATLERARYLRDRWPRTFPHLGSDVVLRLQAYDERRAAAAKVGKAVPELPPATIARLDEAAATFEASPPERFDQAGRRAAFRAALAEHGPDAAWREYSAWLEAFGIAELRSTIRADAAAVLGIRWSAGVGDRPRWDAELAAAVDDHKRAVLERVREGFRAERVR